MIPQPLDGRLGESNWTSTLRGLWIFPQGTECLTSAILNNTNNKLHMCSDQKATALKVQKKIEFKKKKEGSQVTITKIPKEYRSAEGNWVQHLSQEPDKKPVKESLSGLHTKSQRPFGSGLFSTDYRCFCLAPAHPAPCIQEAIPAHLLNAGTHEQFICNSLPKQRLTHLNWHLYWTATGSVECWLK